MDHIKSQCAVWGTNVVGQQTAKIAEELGYEVLFFCRSSGAEKDTYIDNIAVVGPEELRRFCVEGRVNHIILGMGNPVNLREVRATIHESFPPQLTITTRDEIDNQYLKKVKENISFRWDVDFKNQAAIWIQNFASEVDFWIEEVAKDKGVYHDSYIQSLKNRDFGGIFETCDEIVKTLKTGSVVMDIGCGLMTKYGNRLSDGQEIKLFPVDPLAYFYNKINEKYAGMEYKASQFGLFEFIANYIEKDYCDLILINNALDHCIDPYKSLIECLYILKKRGKMRLSHRRAEAHNAIYDGLHKWNIDLDDNNNFVIWNQENAINITERLKSICEIQVEYTGDVLPRANQWITVYITKTEDFSLDRFVDIDKERNDLAFFIEKLMEKMADFTEMYLT